jgi:hypothetical protein
MNRGVGPDWAKRGAILTLVGIVVALWIGYTGSPGFRSSVDRLVGQLGPLLSAAAAVLAVCALAMATLKFGGHLRGALRWAKTFGMQVRWWVLWRRLGEDVRSRIESLNQIGAEVLAATLRVGERRQDRRFFLPLRDAEALVRRRRHPPQAGIGGTAWAKKGCEELKQAGLVEQFGDTRNYEYMVWLRPALLKSRAGGSLADAVEGLLATRGLWRW